MSHRPFNASSPLQVASDYFSYLATFLHLCSPTSSFFFWGGAFAATAFFLLCNPRGIQAPIYATRATWRSLKKPGFICSPFSRRKRYWKHIPPPASPSSSSPWTVVSGGMDQNIWNSSCVRNSLLEGLMWKSWKFMTYTVTHRCMHRAS